MIPFNTTCVHRIHDVSRFSSLCKYRHTSNISRTLVSNNIADHLDAIGASTAGCSIYILILDLKPGFIGVGKDNRKARWETFMLGDLVRLILEIWRYMLIICGNYVIHTELP